MKLSVAAIFCDSMVLQSGMKVPVWGGAEPGDRITVEFAGQTRRARAGRDGRWRTFLSPMKICPSPGDMTIRSARDRKGLVISDVLVGEVWICSGQSNMDWLVVNSKNPEEEITAANYPRIRVFTVSRVAKVTPRSDVGGKWEICSPENAANFSAVGYYFGREIHRRTGIPVGLVVSSWGGTYAEAWTSREALAGDSFYRKMLGEYYDELENPGEIPERLKEWAGRYEFKDTDNKGEANGWHGVSASPAGWGRMELPGSWQVAGHVHSGIFWFRRNVEIPAEWEGRDLTLSLGPTDKSDITYFNGVRVGSLTMEERQDAWCTPRIYTVPGKLVKAGANVIAVRVFSNIFEGGFIGTARQVNIRVAGSDLASAIPICGTWNYRIEANFGLVPPPPMAERGDNNPNSPHILFDNMISPLVPYAIRGAIWYQGEANAAAAKQYRKLLQIMIRSWRKIWKQGDFPFLIVQLANYSAFLKEPAESTWAELREAQAMALSLPNTGMAVAIDIGEENDIHPRNKQDVGFRLALQALAKTYGFGRLVSSGPLYRRMRIEKGGIRIFFDSTAGGLVSHGPKLTGFSIAGKDRKFVWADAAIDGDQVVVSSPSVKKPVAVRYAWANNPVCNLYNSSDLPASPFRTDKWPGITK